jgi:hydroxymethylpyrimidine kinase/phosphomethylpyrimidine kinase/thiamine-phosphate diphosphorylase
MTYPTNNQSNHRPVVWSIAGTDSGGGAGLQADQKAFEAFGVHGCSVVAAVTAQNSQVVQQLQAVDADLLSAQMDALERDLPPAAIKIGLLGSVENLRRVCRMVDRLREHPAGRSLALVVDPVLGASTGANFADAELLQAYRNELLPRASLITPNRAEAERLLGAAGTGLTSAQAARQLLDTGCEAVVITGGDARHGDSPLDTTLSHDYMLTPQASGWLGGERIATRHNHGTGCVFASSAAAAMACGFVAADALVLAKMAITHALRHAYPAGQGAGPVAPQADFADHLGNLPMLSGVDAAAPVRQVARFAAMGDAAIGVYAVVDSAQWVQRVLDSGIRTVQLRIKDPQDPTLRDQIASAIEAGRRTDGARVFINDHWQLALQEGAWGVHLGQEDLEGADIHALQAAGIRLGISTHSYWEVVRARALGPSYIACGPIFPTQAKVMPWIPQGMDNLRYWSALLDQPVVGIAGIGKGNMQAVAECGPSGAAVISAITAASDPRAACEELMAAFASGRAQRGRAAAPRARPTLERRARSPGY